MSEIRKVLFPVDFSGRCTLAVAQVKLWAERFSAGITSLHVVDPKDYFVKANRPEDPFWDKLPTYMAKRNRDLDYFCESYFGQSLVNKVVLSGDTAEQIVAFAESEKMDLVMLPVDHQSLGSRWLHDCLAAKVLNDCPAAVWVTEHATTSPIRQPKHVLCAIHVIESFSLDGANHRMLQLVRAICTGFGASATCLFVGNFKSADLCEPMQPTVSLAISERLSEIHRLMEDIANFETGTGSVTNAIVETAMRTNSDLIVLGRTRPFTPGLGLQQHLLTVDHRASCPVVSIS